MMYGPLDLSTKVYEVLPFMDCVFDPLTNTSVCHPNEEYVYYSMCIILFLVVFTVSYFVFKFSRAKIFLGNDGNINTKKVLGYALGLAIIVTMGAVFVSSK